MGIVGIVFAIAAVFSLGVAVGYYLQRRLARKRERKLALGGLFASHAIGTQPIYDLERDERVSSILGPEGFALSRRLEAAKRIDRDKFNAAFDPIFQGANGNEQSAYLRLHRERFFEMVNLSAELTADLEHPLILDFGIGEHTRLFKSIFPDIRLHVAEYPGRWGISGLNVDHGYEVDLSSRASREASLVPIKEFDLVMFSEVIEHLIVNPIEVIEWLLSLVKPNGYLVITTPNMFSKNNIPVYLAFDNPLAPFPMEDTRALGQAHLREYSHIELLRFIQIAGASTEALMFSSCWDDDKNLAPVERKNLVLVASPAT
jgi:hypothetical protein